MALQLVVLEMPGLLPGLPQPTNFNLQPDPARPLIFIGRQADNDIVLPDSSVSRHHVEVQVFNDGVAIRDLGSANGTWLNNEQLAPQVRTLVKSGDRLRVGNVLTMLKAPGMPNIEELPTTAVENKTSQATVFNQPNPNNYGPGVSNQLPYTNPNSAGYNSPQPNYNPAAPPVQPTYNPANYSNPNNPASGYAPGYNQPYAQPQPDYGYNNQPGATAYNPNAGGHPAPPTGNYGTYNPVEYTPGYVPVQPTPMPRPTFQNDNYVPDLYSDDQSVQNRQPGNGYRTGQNTQARPARRTATPYFMLIPLLLAVVIVLAVGGFFLVQALNKNTTSYTTLEQLNLPSSPASANSVSDILGVRVPVFNSWRRAQDPAGNRIVFSKAGQNTTALTIEKPPSATLVNGNLSPEAAVRQYVANVQANAQNVSISTQPVQVKLKDGNIATLAILQFSVPNTVAEYRMHVLAVQCSGQLYFVTAAAESKNDDNATDTDLKAAIANTICK